VTCASREDTNATEQNQIAEIAQKKDVFASLKKRSKN
jgi:hypothetical protein